MSQPPNQPPPSNEDSGRSGLTAGTLRTMIREEIKNVADTLFKGPGQQQQQSTQDSGQPTDIKGEVARALASLAKRNKDEERDKKLDKLLEDSATPPQKPPVERSKAHRFMGWGDNEQ